MGYLLPGLLVIVLIVTVKSDDYDLDIENTLRTLLSPDEYPTIQLQALRRSILQRLINRIDEEQQQPNDLDDLVDRWNKRNLEALARAGLVRTLPLSPQDNDGNNNNNNNDDDESNLKRSLSSLIKNGQLPQTYQNSKRGIQSLARNGELIQHRSNFDNTNDEYDFYKRNVASLARNFNLPSAYGKRFVGSLAKSGDLRFGKRNIASIARDGIKIGGGKRSLQSIKAQMGPNHRQKRQIDYYETNEYPSPVYQNQNVYDYEELMKALTGVYPNTEKRFLGRLPQMGKPKTTPPPKTRYH